jgi:uncharacterized protein
LRLVLDTNVWLDWLVFDDPGVSHVRHAVTEGRAVIYVDDPCMAELERVLAYPLRGDVMGAEAQRAALAEAAAMSQVLDRAGLDPTAAPAMPLPRCSDPDDQKFLQLARDAAAHALITKDRALLTLARRKSRPLPFLVSTPSGTAL